MSEWKTVVSHVHVSSQMCMVAESSCVLRRWFALESYHDGTSEERLEQLEQALQQAGKALRAANCAGHSCDNHFICLDGRHACARETLLTT